MALGRRWFGKLKANLQGRESWERQDSQNIWSDGGEVKNKVEQVHGTLRTVLDAAAKDMERIVSDNAIVAVSDFANDATAAIRAEGGAVIVGIRFETKQAAMIVEFPLEKLIVMALTDMKSTLGVDPQAQEAVSSLVAFGRKLANLGQAPQVQQAPRGNASSAAIGVQRGRRADAQAPRMPDVPEPPPFPGPVMA